jgi:hypothetical protein
VSRGRPGGATHRHGGWRRDRRAVAASDDALGGLQAREGDDLLGVSGAIEAHDRRLAEDGLDAAQRPDWIVADRRSRSRPRVRGQPHPLADGKRRRWLLLGARWPAGLRTRRRAGDHHGCDHLGLLAVVLIVVILIVIAIDDHLDVLDDVDLDHVLDDDVGLDNLVEGGLFLRFLGGVTDRGVGIWCASGHI